MFRHFFRPHEKPAPTPRRSLLHLDAWPGPLYAIGDIHGCHDLFAALLAQIYKDAKDAEDEVLIVTLGDYVDRGPKSAEVLDLLLAPSPDGFRRISLCGNHEIMMLDFIDGNFNYNWLDNGGLQTLESYGMNRAAIEGGSHHALQRQFLAYIPQDHIDLLRRLPVALTLPDLVLVHAGLRPGIGLGEQDEQDLLWIRGEFLDVVQQDGPLVVHGHTPAVDPVQSGRRICVDTGAYASGTLTAVCLTPYDPPRFLQATA
jgi:serine/threonine protein phosphatase 1